MYPTTFNKNKYNLKIIYQQVRKKCAPQPSLNWGLPKFCFSNLRIYFFQEETESYTATDELEVSVQNCLSATRELEGQLIETAREQGYDLLTTSKAGSQLVASITNAALASDEIRMHHSAQAFSHHIDHIIEVECSKG